jgi:hypothetical protein
MEVWDTLDSLEQKPTLLIHGDCRGVDHFARDWALKHGIQTLAMPAPWDRYGPPGQPGNPAGPHRNQAMVNVLASLMFCEWQALAIVFPGPKSVGTFGFLELCKQASVPTYVRLVKE